MFALISPLKGQETPILKERPTGPDRVSRMTTRDEDLERQAKKVSEFLIIPVSALTKFRVHSSKYKAARKAIPGAFFVAEVSDEECEILINPTVSFTHAIRPGGPGRDHSGEISFSLESLIADAINPSVQTKSKQRSPKFH